MEQTTTLRVPLSQVATAGKLAALRGAAPTDVLRDAITRGLDAIAREEQERQARLTSLFGTVPASVPG